MFGTNRTIGAIGLDIYPVEDDEAESCSAWGSVSHTTDIDFRDVTFDDILTFILRLKTDQFSRLARMIAEKSINGGTVSVHDVEGFYSDWSPAISTDDIKVLTNYEEDHPIEVPERCPIVPPRLGKVREFELTVYDGRKFEVRPDPDSDCDADNLEDGESSQPALSLSGAPVARPIVDAKTLGVLKSLRIAAWIIAGLLFLILIK